MYLELQIALAKDEGAKVTDILSSIDLRTANEAFRDASKKFGFKTVEIGGELLAHLAGSSQILGHSDPSSLGKLMERYQIYCPKISTYGQNARRLIRKAFNLDPKDGMATLLSWKGFLIAGMYGRNEKAEEIKLYLLEKEAEARILKELSQKEYLEIEKSRQQWFKLEMEALAMAERLSDERYKSLIAERFEFYTGRKLPEPKQGRLPLAKAPADHN